jgi:hypothetical protein
MIALYFMFFPISVPNQLSKGVMLDLGIRVLRILLLGHV